MVKILLKGKLSEIIKTLNELREDIFDSELEMNKYKNKIRFVKNLLLIEDSRDIVWR